MLQSTRAALLTFTLRFASQGIPQGSLAEMAGITGTSLQADSSINLQWNWSP